MQKIFEQSLVGLKFLIIPVDLTEFNYLQFILDGASFNVSTGAFKLDISGDGTTFNQRLPLGNSFQAGDAIKTMGILEKSEGVATYRNLVTAVPPNLPSPRFMSPSEEHIYTVDLEPDIVAAKIVVTSGLTADAGVIRVVGA